MSLKLTNFDQQDLAKIESLDAYDVIIKVMMTWFAY